MQAEGSDVDNQYLTVGCWTVRPDRNEIARKGEVAALQPLSMDILVYLARHAGEVVTAQELIDAFWKRRAVGDDAVHRRIADLRRHLGDDSRSPSYIQTVPKRGYRLIAGVSWQGPSHESVAVGRRQRSRLLPALLGIAAVAIAVTAVLVLTRGDADPRLDEAMMLAEGRLVEDQYQSAYEALRPFVGERDERVAELLDRIAVPVTLLTDPPGVEVLYRYAGSGGEWRSLGSTPIDNRLLPRGNYRLRIGDRVLLNATNPGATFNSAGRMLRSIELPVADLPADMVYVPGGSYRLGAWGFEDEIDLGPFLLDRTEVTNADYLRFVESGGYLNPEFWRDAIEASAGELRWDDVGRLFVDQTGAPGPAGWTLGSYAPGDEDLPVVGVSWYEASAYLSYRGKSMPSVHHWLRSALGPMEWKYPFASFLVPASNIDGPGLLPVGERIEAESSGAFDLIGNAAEWTSSGAPDGRAVIGASFRDPRWAYNFPRPTPAMLRRDDTGFRGMLRTDGSRPDPEGNISVFTDFTSSLRQVSDEMFAGIRLGFEYAEGTVKAADATTIEEKPFAHWTRRIIELPSGYDDDPLPVYLYLPKKPSADLQAILFLPPADSWSPGFRSTSIEIESYQLDFVPRGGRALVWPVYYGSQERYDNYHAAPVAERANRALERNRRVRNEIGRVIDYLDGSPEFDGEKIGLIGLSHGAILASYNLATEQRIRAAVLYSVGLAMPNPVFRNPQNDPNVYWARVRQPTLIINGRYDPLRPASFVVDPLVSLLATPTDSKKAVLYDSSHWPLPRFQMMRDSLEWFDRYLGPVAPAELSY